MRNYCGIIDVISCPRQDLGCGDYVSFEIDLGVRRGNNCKAPDTGFMASFSVACKTDGRWQEKLRELIGDLKAAGFKEVPGGKGSYRKYTHENYAGAVTISGKSGDDAKRYQEKQVI